MTPAVIINSSVYFVGFAYFQIYNNNAFESVYFQMNYITGAAHRGVEFNYLNVMRACNKIT